MAEIRLINKTERSFIDISTEEWRCYLWDSGEERVWIEDPQWLAISESGHYILDRNGVSHYVPFGWRHLKWKAITSCAHFVQ